MTIPHLAWFLLLLACLAWYGLLTFYVAWHGGRDIIKMLERLSHTPESSPSADSSDP
jgi:hypothetical protein